MRRILRDFFSFFMCCLRSIRRFIRYDKHLVHIFALGKHVLTDFSTETHASTQTPDSQAPRYGHQDTSYKAAGEFEGIKQLVDHFYDAMETLPEAKTIREMHPEDLTESRDKLTRFLCGWLGGPKLFSEKYGSIRIPVAHRHLEIGPAERDAWLLCMKVAADKQHYAEDFKDYLLKQLYVPAERSRNRD